MAVNNNKNKNNNEILCTLIEGRVSTVGVGTGYGLESPGIESRLGAELSALVQTGLGALPASYTVGTWFFEGVKRPGRGIDHPPQLAPRLKKE